MKKVTNLLIAMLLCFGMAWGQTTVTIGTGTATTTNFPIASTYAYTYTQQIYTQVQINTEGTITKIRFYHATGAVGANSESWVVYMGHTTKVNFNNNTAWEPLANLTEVFNGTITSPGPGNWVEITLTTPFVYNNANNLLVAVDENAAGAETFAWGGFSSANNTGIYVRGTSNINPSSPGTASGRNATINRIQLDFTLPNVLNPATFGSVALNGYKIYLGWTKNANANDVIIASNTANSFGTPANGTTYNIDDMIGTAKVIYQGDAISFVNSGLNPLTPYYYKVWSVDGSYEYSSGKTTTATTLCATYATFATESFTATTFPPTCWTSQLIESDAYPTGTNWNRTSVTAGSHGGTARAYFYNDQYYSTFDLNTIEFNVPRPVLTFQHAYTSYSGEPDALQIGYSSDGGYSWYELVYLEGGSAGPLVTAPSTTSSFVPTAAQWATKSFAIPVEGDVKIKFRAISGYGNNLYLDDISVVSGLNVTGTVTSSLTGNPVAGAQVIFGTGAPVTTLADGTYHTWMVAGTYNVSCTATGFNPASQAGVVIAEGSVVNFALSNPTMDIVPLTITENVIYGTTPTKEISITNNGNGPLSWELESKLIRTAKKAALQPGNGITEIGPKLMDQAPNAMLKGHNKAGSNMTDAYTTCPDGSVFSTEPDVDSWGVVTSEADPGYSVYQYFKGANAPIDGISFWGGNLFNDGTAWSSCGTENPMTFAIKFYEDAGGVPGALVASFTKAINRLDTGIPLSTYGDMYMYTCSFDEEIDLPRGWVSVVGQTASPDCWFMWAASSSATAEPYLQWDGVAPTYGVGDYSVSMCLNGGGTWLTADQYAGTVLPGQTSVTTLSLDGNYVPGVYNASLGFYSDPNVGVTVVPVNMIICSGVVEKAPILEALQIGGTSDVEIPFVFENKANVEWTAFFEDNFTNDIGWAKLTPASGVAETGQVSTTTLTFTAPTVKTVDSYFSKITILGLENQAINIPIRLDVYSDPFQKILVPPANSWGGISSNIDLMAKGPASMEFLLSDILDKMVILVGEQGFFWPGQNINTFPGGNWNTDFGYKIKMAENELLVFMGNPVQNKTVTFGPGVHIIPVLSTEPVSAHSIFDNKPIEYAFGYDGSIFWPAGGIYTLTTLVPGYGYLVRFNETATLDFGAPKEGFPTNNLPVFVNNTTWNNVSGTGDVHIIGVAPEACTSLMAGDVLGVFNIDGLCTAMAEYSGNGEAFALVAYADDQTTTVNDGMIIHEPMILKVFRNGHEMDVNPVYNTEMPNADGLFVNNGLSQITNLKLGPLAIGENGLNGIAIYPNPSSGIFNINLTGTSNLIETTITNSQGQLIYTSKLSGSQQIDLSSQPKGIYFIRLVNESSVKLEKLIVK